MESVRALFDSGIPPADPTRPGYSPLDDRVQSSVRHGELEESQVDGRNECDVDVPVFLLAANRENRLGALGA